MEYRNLKTRDNFNNKNFIISFDYRIDNEQAGHMELDLISLIDKPSGRTELGRAISAATLKKFLSVALLSADAETVFDFVLDFIDYALMEAWIKPEKAAAYIRAVEGFNKSGRREEKAPEIKTAEKLGRKFLPSFKRATTSYKLYQVHNNYLYITDGYAALKIPTAAAGPYFDYFKGSPDGLKESETLIKVFQKDYKKDAVKLEYKSTITGYYSTAEATADYYFHAGTFTQVLLDVQKTKIFEAFKLEYKTAATCSNSPVFFESPEKDQDGAPVYEGLILPMRINTDFEKKINRITPPENYSDADNDYIKELKEAAPVQDAPAKEEEAPKMKNNVIPREFYQILALRKDTNERYIITKNNERGNYHAITQSGEELYFFGSHLRNADFFEILEIRKDAPKTGEDVQEMPATNKTTTEPADIQDEAKTDEGTAKTETAAPDFKTEAAVVLSSKATNANIIMLSGIEAGVITKKDFIAYIENGTTPAFHTFQAWKAAGYIVKRGEKAKFSALIWKNAKKTISAADGEKIESEKYFKKNAYFFGADQVEKIN